MEKIFSLLAGVAIGIGVLVGVIGSTVGFGGYSAWIGSLAVMMAAYCAVGVGAVLKRPLVIGIGAGVLAVLRLGIWIADGAATWVGALGLCTFLILAILCFVPNLPRKKLFAGVSVALAAIVIIADLTQLFDSLPMVRRIFDGTYAPYLTLITLYGVFCELGVAFAALFLAFREDAGSSVSRSAVVPRAVGTSTQAASSADELKKLHDLVSAGALTQEEFEEQKKKLLS